MADIAFYPFCAVVGREREKLALLLHAVHPRLGGVLLCGDAGTAKSTLVRGLAELLPYRRVAIPPHVTEDRLLGGLDADYAIRSGRRRLTPGLLAEADGGLAAVDDANRMPERLLGEMLRAAEDGTYAVEREGLSEQRASRFRLLGTMSAAEEPMPPAQLDRWALFVRVEASRDAGERAEIVRRRLAFERDPAAFARRWEAGGAALRERIAAAADRLAGVKLGEEMLRFVAETAAAGGCPGHRAELALGEAARALAAWEGCAEVQPEHVRAAASYALAHRLAAGGDAEPQGDGQPDGQSDSGGRADWQDDERANRQDDGDGEAERRPPAGDGAAAGGADARAESKEGRQPRETERGAGTAAANGAAGAGADAAREIVAAVGRAFDVRRFDFAPPRPALGGRAGRRNAAAASLSRRGRYVRARLPQGRLADLALDATLRAAAPYQRLRRQRAAAEGDGRVLIERGDLREKVREHRTGTALMFVVDGSGSMNAAKRMKAVKGAVLSLLHDAYRQRDHAGLIVFRGESAELLLDLTRSVELAERKLRSLPTGGRTPLAAGLAKGAETLLAAASRHGGLVPVMIVITDGRANAGSGAGGDPWRESRQLARRIAESGLRSLVIDTEQGAVRLGLARELAADLQAQYCRLDELESGRIERAVRAAQVAAHGGAGVSRQRN